MVGDGVFKEARGVTKRRIQGFFTASSGRITTDFELDGPSTVYISTGYDGTIIKGDQAERKRVYI